MGAGGSSPCGCTLASSEGAQKAEIDIGRAVPDSVVHVEQFTEMLLDTTSTETVADSGAQDMVCQVFTAENPTLASSTEHARNFDERGDAKSDVVGNAKPLPQDEVARSGAEICIMVHGLGGTLRDFDVWVEVLTRRCPKWHLRPLQGLAKGTRALGDGVNRLAQTAANEIIETARSVCGDLSCASFTLHCIGHSMGGLIIRGALPSVLEEFGSAVAFGHYLSLSSPHLGTKATSRQMAHFWRNASIFTKPLSSQFVQLSIQDGSKKKEPYLMEISDASGEHMDCLRRFQKRTCVSLDHGDPLVPVTSGVIDPQSVIATPCSAKKWNFRLVTVDVAANPRTKEEDRQGKVFPLTLRKSVKAIMRNTFRRASLVPAKRTELTWKTSRDGSCLYPEEVFAGLSSVDWHRIVVEVRHPLAANLHVFLIGKIREQFTSEHAASKQCIEFLVGLVFD